MSEETAVEVPGVATPAPTSDTSDTTNAAKTCSAVTRRGTPCAYRSVGVHPDQGRLCGVHMRAALSRPECSICLDDVSGGTGRRLGCGHVFHKDCIRKWLQSSATCPMCREVCLEDAGRSRRLSDRVEHLFSVLPPPPRVFFGAYVLALLNVPEVVRQLRVRPEDHRLLMDLAYVSFTLPVFLEYLRVLGM